MNNIVPLHQAHTASAMSSRSPIMFHAYERPLWYSGTHGDHYADTHHKALVRVDDNNQPICLNVVKDTYRLVQNAELFEAVERGLGDTMGVNKYDIVDKIAYYGRTCYRQYIFRDVNVESPERDKIVFRVVVQNGFGGSAIKLHAGAIDMFCTNGMILGDFESVYSKHTSGVRLMKFEETVKRAVDVFWKNAGMWNQLRATIINSDEAVLKWLQEKFSDRLGQKLFHHYLIEQRSRGGKNLWALYSTLTYYASHAEGDFVLRETRNDHAAATMLVREQQVHKVLQSGALLDLRIAA